VDLLFKHQQEKKDKKGDTSSKCLLELYFDGDTINYNGLFDFNYSNYGKKKNIFFQHFLNVNVNNGDITVTYKIINDNLTNEKIFKTSSTTKKNDFKKLKSLTEYGFEKGEKRHGFWGVKYDRATTAIFNKIYEILKPKFKSNYYINNYQTDVLNNKFNVNKLYDLIVDFHLDCKKIKSHDNIYTDIQYVYPKKKWLLKNDNKFLSAVLDSYGIKSKYLIGEIQKQQTKINLNSLNYLCKLFGDNFLDYIKKIDWVYHCIDEPSNSKIHILKNESEKNCLIKVINDWNLNDDTIRLDSLVSSLKNIFTIRTLIEDRGIPLKFNPRNANQYDNLLETWLGIKLHLNRGYKMMYTIPKEVIDNIEQEIIVNNQIFKPKVLITEDDYRLEGFMMKNCMSKQFMHGSLYIYISLRNNKKRINLQYRKGSLVQSYGKANTPTTELFLEPISILNQRVIKFSDITWKKDKYDLLS
jgi:hypothetical protein